MILITGAGGFIGGWLVKRLLEDGERVRAVDIKAVDGWHQLDPRAENLELDLRTPDACFYAASGAKQVYNLAADMGGIGFIESHKADCMRSVLINTHLLEASRTVGVRRYFFASSACVYPQAIQQNPSGVSLAEPDAYHADPEDGYGWEKLFSERMCRHYREDYGLETRIGRFHNSYGPHGTWDGGREKAPAAICRKVAEAKRDGKNTIDVWGDGEQTRSFMWIEDNVEGILRLMRSYYAHPVNIGSSELVTINRLVELVEIAADVKLTSVHDLDAPQGVRGRNSDNTLIRDVLGWEPETSLLTGLTRTYNWIEQQVTRVPA